MYKLELTAKFKRVLKKCGRSIQLLIMGEIWEMGKNPFLHPQVKKIRGLKLSAYRLRIGRWRVLFFIIKKDRVIQVINLFNKKSDADYRKYFQ